MIKLIRPKVDLLSKELEENLNLNDIEDKLVVNSFEKEVTNEILSIYKKFFQRAIWLYDYENKSSSQPPLIPAVSCVESFFQKTLQEIESRLIAACSKLRTVIERGLETELLSGLVTRYNRNICSQKVRYLNAIEKSDVDFFDKMMSKYSCFEHSQPTEKTIPLPDLADFEKDIKCLLDWNDSFSKKKKKYN